MIMYVVYADELPLILLFKCLQRCQRTVNQLSDNLIVYALFTF